MLARLVIRNFIIIEHSDVGFSAGFTAITGETGAGKSLLLDALQLVLGGRASADVLGISQDHCEIRACFSLPEHFFSHSPEITCPPTFCLSRQITNKGKNKIRLDEKNLTLPQLQSLAGHLLEISGQNLSLQLLRPDAQRELLDRFGQHGPLLKQVAEAFENWQKKITEYQKLQAAQAQRQERLDWLARELAALEQLNPLAGEWEELEQEQQRLGQVDAYQALLDDILLPLYEKPDNALKILHKAKIAAERLSQKDASLNNALLLLQQSQVYLEEAVEEWRDYQQHLKHDPARLAEIDARLERLAATAKRLRCAPEALPLQWATWIQEQNHWQHLETEIAEAEAKRDEAEGHYHQQAAVLHAERLKSAEIFSAAVNSHLAALHLQAVFRVECSSGTPSRHGSDKISFLLQSNRGQPLRPLSKIASGGELSRIQLAIQVASAARLAWPTLIFDEIDSGLGGATAEAIGCELQRLAKHSQVIAITHQAQVAAYADVHLVIRKIDKQGHSRSFVQQLSAEERSEELARMLGGLVMTAQTRALAQELLARGQAAITD
jgi:DNA repair protein RecN (Recombination protein N)